MENREIKLSTNANDILNIENDLEHNILSKQTILDDMNGSLTSYLVCYINNVSVGYIAFSNCIDHIDVVSVAVKPEYRNNGIAKQLFRHLENIMSKKIPIFLEVRASNIVAIELYTSLGFKNIYKRANYYKNPNENALIYAKNV